MFSVVILTSLPRQEKLNLWNIIQAINIAIAYIFVKLFTIIETVIVNWKHHPSNGIRMAPEISETAMVLNFNVTYFGIRRCKLSFRRTYSLTVIYKSKCYLQPSPLLHWQFIFIAQCRPYLDVPIKTVYCLSHSDLYIPVYIVGII